MFRNFTSSDVEVAGVRLRVRVGGSGPAVLLLHGFPQTSVMWHRVADQLGAAYTVVAPDLRGYGDSARPRSGDDHAGYTFRAMAADGLGLMRALGHERFAVVATTVVLGSGTGWASTTPMRWSGWACSTSCRPGTSSAPSTGGWRWATTTGSSSRSLASWPST